MKAHTKIYMNYFGYNISDFIPCEICGQRAVDIHHIECRGMGGTKKEEEIENIMALCRRDHEKYGDRKEYRDKLKTIHLKFIKS